jgi:hypothetical protein
MLLYKSVEVVFIDGDVGKLKAGGMKVKVEVIKG